jgi:hypothetical protein
MDGQEAAGVAGTLELRDATRDRGIMDGRGPARDAGTEPEGHTCGEDVCITCSDIAVPSRVIELRDAGLALVDTGSTMEVISVALVDAGPGDTVLVHAGEAIGVIARV